MHIWYEVVFFGYHSTSFYGLWSTLAKPCFFGMLSLFSTYLWGLVSVTIWTSGTLRCPGLLLIVSPGLPCSWCIGRMDLVSCWSIVHGRITFFGHFVLFVVGFMYTAIYGCLYMWTFLDVVMYQVVITSLPVLRVFFLFVVLASLMPLEGFLV